MDEIDVSQQEHLLESKISHTPIQLVSSDLAEQDRTFAPSTPWRAGIVRRFPFLGFLALLLTLICAAAMVNVLFASNNTLISDWSISPAVYLAAISAIANMLLSFALAEGVEIAWWVKSMRPGTNISDLHKIWAYGTSINSALLSGRSFNRIALAGLVVGITPVIGPILQRASTVATMSLDMSVELTIFAAQEFPVGYTGTITGREHQVSFLTSNFSSVTQDYVLKRPINVAGSGCQGHCSGVLKAAGYYINCENSVAAFNVSSDLAVSNGQVNTAITIGTNVFATNFTYSEDSFADNEGFLHPSLNYTSMYKSDDQCWGDLNVAMCSLQPALLEYHIIIENDSLTLDPQYTYKDDHLIEYVPTSSNMMQGPTTHGGMYLALSSLFGSAVRLSFNGAAGYELATTGVPALQYALAGLPSDDNMMDCPTYWSDPTDDMLAAARELAFRTSLKAADASNATNVQTLDASLENVVTIYRSHYLYLVIALGITLLSTACIVPIFLGWWHLGRRVSLSPIEVAKAFDAPVLFNSDSNLGTKELLRQVGQRAVRYGAVVIENGDDRGQEKLVIEDPAYVGEPTQGSTFTG